MTGAARQPDRDGTLVTVGRYVGAGDAWDAFVRRRPEASWCHLWVWLEVMSDVFGHTCCPLAAWRPDGELLGVLPLVRVSSPLFGDYLMSMPFLNYGGPVGTARAQAALASHAAALARQTGADLLELRCRHRVRTALRVSSRKVAVVLPLPASTEELWRDGLSSKVRSQIRRPLKAGLEARFGGDEVGPFYDVFARHMSDLGTPVLPRSLFERIAWVFRDRVEFGVVYDREIPVAGGCAFVWRDECEITWAAALKAYSRAAPNMLLYWSFMKRMIGRRVRRFDFGRCTPGGGTHRFKRQWGGQDEALPWLQWSASGVEAPPSPERRHYRLAAAAWRQLPLRVSRRLGPVLARAIP